MAEQPAIIVEEDQITILDPERVIREAKEKHRKGGRPRDEVRLAQGKRAIQPAKGWWPEEKKIEVATLHQSGLTNRLELEKLTGVPESTIRDWQKSEFWLELLDKINNVKDQEVVSKFNTLVDSTLEEMQDRIINGDYFVNKRTGQVERVKPKLRDLTAASSHIIDKRQLLRGKATSRSEKIEVNDRLANLAEQFRRFVTAKDVTSEGSRDDQERGEG